MNRPLRAVGVLAAVASTAGLVTALGGTDLGGIGLAGATSVTATTGVHIRSGPGTDYRILGSLYRGQSITQLADAKDGWVKVRFHGGSAYIAGRYLAALTTGTANLPPAPTPIATSGTKTATALLRVRSTPSATTTVIGYISKGQRVTLTGTTSGAYAEVLYGGRRAWVTARYLSASTSLPKVVGTRYATTLLSIRSSPDTNYSLIATVPRGAKLSITGVQSNGRAQIVYGGAVRWVTAQYLSTAPSSSSGSGGTSAPSSAAIAAVEKGLKPNAIKVHRAAMTTFPSIRTYYGVHADPLPDHPTGHALDLMLPYSDYKSATARAFGKQVAEWARANAKTLGIQYVIWDQHIWNIQRDSEGWRPMADRGNDSANHKNHVHITVY